jgi:hypothetical protein
MHKRIIPLVFSLSSSTSSSAFSECNAPSGNVNASLTTALVCQDEHLASQKPPYESPRCLSPEIRGNHMLASIDQYAGNGMGTPLDPFHQPMFLSDCENVLSRDVSEHTYGLLNIVKVLHKLR